MEEDFLVKFFIYAYQQLRASRKLFVAVPSGNHFKVSVNFIESFFNPIRNNTKNISGITPASINMRNT